MCDPTSAYDELYSMQHHVIKIVSDGVKQFINVYQCIQWLTNPPLGKWMSRRTHEQRDGHTTRHCINMAVMDE